MCAMILTLRHPDLFRTFMNSSCLAGPRYGDDTSDDIVPYDAAKLVVPLTERAGIETCLPGDGHTANVWTAALEQSFEWIAATRLERWRGKNPERGFTMSLTQDVKGKSSEGFLNIPVIGDLLVPQTVTEVSAVSA